MTWYSRQWLKPSQRKRNARRKSGSLRRLYKQLRKEEKQKAKEKGKDAEFQRIARRDKKAFLSEQCKEIDRMGNTRDLFKEIRDTKGTVHAWMGLLNDRNCKDPKCCTQYGIKFGKLSSHRTWKFHLSFQSQRRAMPKIVQTTYNYTHFTWYSGYTQNPSS